MFRCVVVCLMCLFVLFISRSLRIAGSRQKQHVCFLFGTNVIVVLVYVCVCLLYVLFILFLFCAISIVYCEDNEKTNNCKRSNKQSKDFEMAAAGRLLTLS